MRLISCPDRAYLDHVAEVTRWSHTVTVYGGETPADLEPDVAAIKLGATSLGVPWDNGLASEVLGQLLGAGHVARDTFRAQTIHVACHHRQILVHSQVAETRHGILTFWFFGCRCAKFALPERLARARADEFQGMRHNNRYRVQPLKDAEGRVLAEIDLGEVTSIELHAPPAGPITDRLDAKALAANDG